MDTFPSPEQEIVAGAEFFVNHIFVVLPHYDEKIAIFFYSSVFHGFQGFFPSFTMVLYECVPAFRSERSGTTDFIPDRIHPMYLQGGALSIKAQS
jgi:hypothetical protein